MDNVHLSTAAASQLVPPAVCRPGHICSTSWASAGCSRYNWTTASNQLRLLGLGKVQSDVITAQFRLNRIILVFQLILQLLNKQTENKHRERGLNNNFMNPLFQLLLYCVIDAKHCASCYWAKCAQNLKIAFFKVIHWNHMFCSYESFAHIWSYLHIWLGIIVHQNKEPKWNLLFSFSVLRSNGPLSAK